MGVGVNPESIDPVFRSWKPGILVFDIHKKITVWFQPGLSPSFLTRSNKLHIVDNFSFQP